ncbi:type II secretion system F family protein [soil metagenome]
MNPEMVIPLLVGVSVVLIGGAILLAKVAKRAPLEARLGQIGGPSMGRYVPSTRSSGRLTDVVQNIGAKVSSSKSSISLREQLTQAGYHQAEAASVYIGAKIILLIIGLGVSLALIIPTNFTSQHKVTLIGMIAMGLFFLPNMVVASRKSKRCGLIRRHLPDAIDLLEICASAGMGLDTAWNAVTDEVRTVCSVLADEMALTNLEIHLGATRTDAMRHMAKRTGAEELSSLVAMLLQAERFGTSISEGLQAYATYMRETRSQRAQEAAEKMAIKLIFPMVVAIFPAVVLLMAGPAFISLYKATRPG